MNLENAVVLVTGANRGLGLAFARELLARGARKVYSGARDPATVALPGVQPIRLNVTRAEHVPDVVVRRTLDALEAGAEEVLADDTARDVKRGLSAEPAVYLQDIAG